MPSVCKNNDDDDDATRVTRTEGRAGRTGVPVLTPSPVPLRARRGQGTCPRFILPVLQTFGEGSTYQMAGVRCVLRKIWGER